MNYDDLITKIMPLVEEYSNEQFIVHRVDGEWELTRFDSLATEPAKSEDPYAIMVKGEDYGRGSFSYVHDKVLIDRMWKEYDYLISKMTKKPEMEKLFGLMDYLDENLAAISTETMRYIATLKHPLALMGVMPIELDNGAITEESANSIILKMDRIAGQMSTNMDAVLPNEKLTEKGVSKMEKNVEKKIRTIAFQVDDPEFIRQYEARLMESGMKVKEYFINLINCDIAKSQTQKSDSAPGTDITEEVSQTEQNNVINDQQAVDTLASTPPIESTGLTEDAIHNQGTPDVSEPEELMNFFAKITKDQREALEHHKSETGENAGSVLIRIVNGFLNDVREGNLTEEHSETLKYYTENVKSCNTTCSARMPVKTNQELADYLNEAGGASRNALIASLVHRELHSQEMTQEQNLTL